MKKTKIIYWLSTVIVGVMMLIVGVSYLTNDEIQQAFMHLGFPDYFRVELGIAKIIGSILLLIPFTGRLKEWVYAGFTITFCSAFIAHMSSGDPASKFIAPLIFLGILALSYSMNYKLNANKQNIPNEKDAVVV